MRREEDKGREGVGSYLITSTHLTLYGCSGSDSESDRVDLGSICTTHISSYLMSSYLILSLVSVCSTLLYSTVSLYSIHPMRIMMRIRP
jgi:hypothetical protein